MCPRLTGTERPKPTRHPSKVIVGWCYGDSTQCTLPRTYLLSDSQHSLQLRRSIPECNDLSQFKELIRINLIAYLPLVRPTDNSCRDPDLIPGRQPARPSRYCGSESTLAPRAQRQASLLCYDTKNYVFTLTCIRCFVPVPNVCVCVQQRYTHENTNREE